jgi:hypothetical protein
MEMTGNTSFPCFFMERNDKTMLDVTVKTQIAILVGLEIGRIGKAPTEQQLTNLRMQIKAYLLDQQIWPSSRIMRQVNRLIDEAVSHMERKKASR